MPRMTAPTHAATTMMMTTDAAATNHHLLKMAELEPGLLLTGHRVTGSTVSVGSGQCVRPVV